MHSTKNRNGASEVRLLYNKCTLFTFGTSYSYLLLYCCYSYVILILIVRQGSNHMHTMEGVSSRSEFREVVEIRLNTTLWDKAVFLLSSFCILHTASCAPTHIFIHALCVQLAPVRILEQDMIPFFQQPRSVSSYEAQATGNIHLSRNTHLLTE